MIVESAVRPVPPPAPKKGGPLGGVEAGVGSVSDWEAGAEVERQVGSWGGRLTARDRELVGHLGLVRYLRTNQIAEMMFRGRAQSVLSARLGELAVQSRHR